MVNAETKTPSTSRLQQWRLQAGMTLTEVADLTGLSVAMISRLERGERGLRPQTRVKVARRLGVRVRTIFEPEDAIPDEEALGGG